jgi:hypothetical protein
MRVTIDLYRADDGRLEGDVCAPDGCGGRFVSVLDLLRILEDLDLTRRTADPDTGQRDRSDDG